MFINALRRNDGFYFSPDDPPAGDPPPQDPPAADPPVVDPPADDPAADPAPTPDPAKEAAKYRRLHEKADKDLKETRAKLTALEAEKSKRDEADLTEAQKAAKRADDAEKRATDAEAKSARLEVAREFGIDDDEAMEFLTATDPDALRAQAEKLAKLTAKPAGDAPPAPLKGGTTTKPPQQQQPSIDEQIAKAEKDGNRGLAITLKRQQAGLNRP